MHVHIPRRTCSHTRARARIQTRVPPAPRFLRFKRVHVYLLYLLVRESCFTASLLHCFAISYILRLRLRLHLTNTNTLLTLTLSLISISISTSISIFILKCRYRCRCRCRCRCILKVSYINIVHVHVCTIDFQEQIWYRRVWGRCGSVMLILISTYMYVFYTYDMR